MFNQLAGNLAFARRWQGMTARVIKQDDAIIRPAEGFLYQIADHQRNFFALAFLLGIGFEVFAFGGEADAKRRVRQRGDFGEDVGIFDETNFRQAARRFFQFLRRDAFGAVIGNGSDGDKNIRFFHPPHDFRIHLQRALHTDAGHVLRHGQGDGTGDERDFRARLPCGAGNGVAHATG